jgi:hypothetical protein
VSADQETRSKEGLCRFLTQDSRSLPHGAPYRGHPYLSADPSLRKSGYKDLSASIHPINFNLRTHTTMSDCEQELVAAVGFARSSKSIWQKRARSISPRACCRGPTPQLSIWKGRPVGFALPAMVFPGKPSYYELGHARLCVHRGRVESGRSQLLGERGREA